MNSFDTVMKAEIDHRLKKLEDHFDADVIFYHGNIEVGLGKLFRDFIEELNQANPPQQRLVIFLNSPGGSVEAVEKMVEIVRFHYREVFFVVPDMAMSAGTVFCMSGNKIYMDYSSSLGPIDPQVFNGTNWVPALGYLDKVEELLAKAQNGTLTQAEFVILQSQDLAMLRRYEQARDLTVSLIKQWLIDYKFADWETHSSSGQSVTQAEKEGRAEEIARVLGDNRTWHSHGRMISGKTLQTLVGLRVEDYSNDTALRDLVRSYNDLVIEYILRSNFTGFLHSRVYF